jgi:hypothetical protein
MANDIVQANVISLLNLENLPDEDKAAMLEKIVGWVEKRVFARILEQLSAEKKAEFLEFLEKNNQSALQDFITANVPNYFALIEEETVAARKELADFNKTLD